MVYSCRCLLVLHSTSPALLLLRHWFTQHARASSAPACREVMSCVWVRVRVQVCQVWGGAVAAAGA